MSKKSRQQYSRIFSRRKQKTERRLKRKQWEEQERPMFRGRNIHYEVAEKNQAINCGGIGAIHQMALRCGLVEEINEKVKLLKVHVPYHESGHVLNIAYNILAGGMRLEDIELNRNNEGYLNALGAQRIPDPTTAGDFTERESGGGGEGGDIGGWPILKKKKSDPVFKQKTAYEMIW